MPSRLRFVAIGTGVVAAYVVAARVGFQFALVAEQITTVWAPTGIAQAALLLWGRSLWPAVFVGALIANAGTQVPLWVAAVIAAGNTLEAVAAATLLRRVRAVSIRLLTVRDVLAFIVVAALLSTAISATVGVVALCASGIQAWTRFGTLWSDWWLGDVLGSLVVAPVLLTMSRPPGGWSRRSVVETAALIVATVVTTEVIFGRLFGDAVATHPVEFVIFPFVVLAAVRLHLTATALVVLTAAAVAIWNTVRGSGPFAEPEVHRSLVLLQTFMGVLAGTGLLLAAAIAERVTGVRRRTAAFRVGETLGAADSLPAAAPAILRAICESLQFQVGTFWITDSHAQRLQCASTWMAADIAADDFVRASKAARFERGQGLPGRVWMSGGAEWIEDVLVDTNFPRHHAAAASGLHGAFAFPIRVDGEIFGIVECFNRSVLTPDTDLLRTMATVGHQIGQFIARTREEAARATAEAERERLLRRESQARAQAEAANRAKDEFLATLSHELRTPLNAIVGWTRLLLGGSLDEAASRKALEVIDRNAQLQTQLIADILDVSRIITGGLRLNLRTLDMTAVIGAALDAVRPAADARHIRITTEFTATERLQFGDPERLQQVIWNLLANSVKFTPPGGSITVALEDGDGDTMCLRVEDDGSGIDPEFLPYIFERFRQADGSPSRQHGGLGLGLAIVRHLVELHGGTVDAASEGAGTGSRFVVVLPRVHAQPKTTRNPLPAGAAAMAPADGSLAGCRVLVVDDEDDARELIAAVLQSAGAEVSSARSVAEALEHLDGPTFDAMLSDIGMPGQDGYALIREVRRREQVSGGHLPAAAVTAYAGTADQARAVAEGFDRHLAKPVAPDAVIGVVRALRREHLAT